MQVVYLNDIIKHMHVDSLNMFEPPKSRQILFLLASCQDPQSELASHSGIQQLPMVKRAMRKNMITVTQREFHNDTERIAPTLRSYPGDTLSLIDLHDSQQLSVSWPKSPRVILKLSGLTRDVFNLVYLGWFT